MNNKEELQAYTARITQANRSELVVIMYELILENMDFAEQAYKAENRNEFKEKLQKAQKFVMELVDTLNFEYTMSQDLLQLYIYVSKQIIDAIVMKEPSTLESAKKVINSLKTGFEFVCKEDDSPSVMQNTQQLYAGLTYGKGTLNETCLDLNQESRGFKA